MKKLLTVSLAAFFVIALLAANSYAEEEKAVTKVGWITCTMCKGKVADAEYRHKCALECVKKHGAKLAFYDNESKETFEIDKQDKVMDLAHAQVELTGVFDVENKKVMMAGIKKIESKEGAKGESTHKECQHKH